MFSYGPNNELILTQNQISQLLASNGSGKSSLAIIIQELLYNKNIKGLKKSDILNRYSDSKHWEAKIEFSVDENEYIVTSKRVGASTNVSFYENGVDISEHKVLDTYKKIADVIGRDFETFSQLTYQSSTDSLEFLKATDTNRKKFLVNLFTLSRYLEIGEDLKTNISSKEKELARKQGEYSTITEFIANNTIAAKAAEKIVPSIDTTLYGTLETAKQQMQEQKSLSSKIDRNNLYITERDGLQFSMDTTKPELDSDLLEKIEDYKRKITAKETAIRASQKDLKSLDISDHCYVCKQTIDNSKSKQLNDTLTKDIKDWTAELNTLRDNLDKLQQTVTLYQNALRIYNKNQTIIDRFTQLSQLIDKDIPKAYPDYKELANNIAKLEKDIAWQEKEHEDAKIFNESVRIRNAKIDGLVEQLREFKVRQQLVNNDIVIIQDEISNLAILRKAFSPSGLVAYKLENAAKQLEEGINHYLALLSDGQFQIIFRLSGDKLNIVVINNGEEVSIDSLSGGEFSRVQTSVLLAVRNTLAKLGGSSINLLFLDEITGVLDASGKERLFEVLQEEEGLNVFLISHDYSHPLIPVIEIIKENNISTINC